MDIVAITLNHHHAPVEVRAKLTPLSTNLHDSLADLARQAQQPGAPLTEGAIICTCNRVEIYVLTHRCDQGNGQLVEFLSAWSQAPLAELIPYVREYVGEQAVAHLFRVACGLDSLVIGENEILGQVRDAYDLARETKAAGPVLSRLFRRAVTIGKRARTNTAISRNAASVSSVAVELARRTFGNLSECRALVVGSGEMGQQALRNLMISGVKEITISSRTRQHAEETARACRGRVADFDRLEAALSEADIVISSTSAPHTVIHVEQVRQAMSCRPDRPLLLIDIAMPPDVEAGVADLPNVSVYNIDALGSVVESNLGKRRQEIPKVEALIDAEVAEFMAWFRSLDLVPTIVALRRHAEAICQEEVQKALRKLGALDERQQRIIWAMAQGLTNKLLHSPTVRLKERAAEPCAHQYSEALRELFDLDGREC